MGYIGRSILVIPTTLIMYRLTENLIYHLVSNLKYSEKVDQSIFISSILSVVLFFAATTIFNEKSRLNNMVVRISCYITGFLIIFNALLSWDEITENTRTIILFIVFVFIILYSYTINNT